MNYVAALGNLKLNKSNRQNEIFFSVWPVNRFYISYTGSWLEPVPIAKCSQQVCAGSSLFLRARFGNGYYLTLVRDDGITKVVDDADQDQHPQHQQLQLQDLNEREDENSLEEVWHIFLDKSANFLTRATQIS